MTKIIPNYLKNLTKSDINRIGLAADAELCKRSLHYFLSQAWEHIEPATYVDNWHIHVLCTHLEAVARSEIKRLIINIPPGHMKSMLVSIFFPVWMWINDPTKQILSTSHSMDFSARDTARARELIQSEWFQERWDLELRDDQNAKTDYKNTKFGFRKAKAFTKLTGARGNLLIIDDPMSAYDANSPTERYNVKTTMLQTVPSRLNDLEEDSIIIIAQRLHMEDIVGVIQDAGLDYEVLSIPARYEGDKIFATSLKMEDPRTEIGELLFAKKFSDHAMLEMEKSLGAYQWSAQYQQNPVPATDGYFNKDWILWYTPEERPKLSEMHLYMTTDHAPSGKGDFNAGVMWGLDHKGHYWFLDAYHKQSNILDALGVVNNGGEYELLNEGFLPMIEKWKPIYWIPEDDNSWKTFEPMARNMMRDTGTNKSVIKPIPTRGGDKEVKNMPFAAACQNGMVHLPKNNQKAQDLVSEMLTFPVGKHDDFIDAAGHIFRAEQLWRGVVNKPPVPQRQVDGYKQLRSVPMDETSSRQKSMFGLGN